MNRNQTSLAAAIILSSCVFVGEAFVPTFPTQSQVGASCCGHRPVHHAHKSSFAGTQAVVMGSVSTGTGTSLSMMGGNGNLFDRFSRVLRSNINKLVSSIENPEKVIVQAVDDMQVNGSICHLLPLLVSVLLHKLISSLCFLFDFFLVESTLLAQSDLIKVRQAYAEAAASQRRLQRQKDQIEAIASDWYNRAQLALQRNNEGLAREALARRQAELDKANTLRMQMGTQNVAVEKLYAAMLALENKIREAAATKEQLVARARTAKTTAAVNDMLSGLTGKTAMDAFHRMQEKVEALEAAAEASAEMSLLPSSGIASTLESEFQMLEQSSAVDLELEKMKKSINETRMLGSSIGMEDSFRERIKIPVGQGAKIF